jgi:phosphoribosylformylglycinamidine cyclo-ligase
MDTQHQSGLTYRGVGVDTPPEDTSLWGLRQWVERTFAFGPKKDSVRLPLGYYANVVDVGVGTGIAISTDGVGTKLLIAQLMGKYDTVGIDCVAMNVNDVICVGAEPVTMVDYVAVERADSELLSQIAKGLFEGAKLANVSIPGGEVAQIREMIRGPVPGKSFDLVGTCVGTVPLDRILYGQHIAPGDVIIGIRSSGIHSNGTTLTRHVLLEKQNWKLDRHIPELGRKLGEELLEPTHIYVPPAIDLLKSDIAVKAFAHITGDGFLNLLRADSTVAYVIDSFPEPHAIFQLIQSAGDISNEEMFQVYNMGIGLCAVVNPEGVEDALRLIRQHNFQCQPIGFIESSPEKVVRIPQYNLVGRGDHFAEEA